MTDAEGEQRIKICGPNKLEEKSVRIISTLDIVWDLFKWFAVRVVSSLVLSSGVSSSSSSSSTLEGFCTWPSTNFCMLGSPGK